MDEGDGGLKGAAAQTFSEEEEEPVAVHVLLLGA